MNTKPSNTPRKKSNLVQIIRVRHSYPALHAPSGYQGSTPKYSTQLLIPKSANEQHEPDEAKRDPVQVQNWTSVIQGLKRLSVEHNITMKHIYNFGPIRDGDEAGNGLEGHYILTAKNSQQPRLFMADMVPFADPLENATSVKSVFYAGCYISAEIEFYFVEKFKRVVALLLGVQFVDNGEPFGLTKDTYKPGLAAYSKEQIQAMRKVAYKYNPESNKDNEFTDEDGDVLETAPF